MKLKMVNFSLSALPECSEWLSLLSVAKNVSKGSGNNFFKETFASFFDALPFDTPLCGTQGERTRLLLSQNNKNIISQFTH